MNAIEIQEALTVALADPRCQENIREAESGDQVWLVANLVSAVGKPGWVQDAEIVEYLGGDASGYYETEMADIADEMSTRWETELEGLIVVPDGCFISVGYWDNGGCWGVILYKE